MLAHVQYPLLTHVIQIEFYERLNCFSANSYFDIFSAMDEIHEKWKKGQRLDTAEE